MHTFPKHPLALAVALALTSPAWADSIAINSTTLDGTRGTVLGNVARQSPMASFHQAQKEMVFATLRHLGVNPDTLPARVRTELERPQTTNPQAFLSFALALDKADKGQYGQASQLLKQASQLDPKFALAKGMEKLMPKVDITPGNNNQTMQNLRQEVREDARRTSDTLTRTQNDTERNLDQRSQNRQGGDGTQRRLNTLASGEESGQGTGENQNTDQQFNNLGISDEGDSNQFDPNANPTNQANNNADNTQGTNQTGTTGDTNANPTGGDGNGQTTAQTAGDDNTNNDTPSNNLALAEQLGTDDNTNQNNTDTNTNPNTNTNTDSNTSSNTDNTSTDANESNQRQELTTNTRPVNGIYGAFLNGQFVSGTVSLDQVLEETAPRSHTYVLSRTGYDTATLIYNVDTTVGADDSDAALGPVTGDVWEVNANYLGLSKKRGTSAFDSSLVGQSGSTVVAQVIAVAGTPTPEAKLPTSGIQSFDLSGLITKNGQPDAISGKTMIDWSAGKLLGLQSLAGQSRDPLLLGELDRDDATLGMVVQQRTNPFDSPDSHYRDSGDISVQLYGSDAPVIGAGFIAMQPRDLQGVAVGSPDQGIIVASQFQDYDPDRHTPASGETWQGPAVGLKQTATGPIVESGTATFVFSPGTATVTGGIDISDHGFGITDSDPNAFISLHAFAGRNTPSSGASSYFSTQGDFTGEGWTDTRYSAMGYWGHDYSSGSSTYSIIDGSTWVAGLPTTNLPSAGWADFAGKALGSLAEISGTETVTDIVTGNISLRVDFERRKTRGSLTDLTRSSNDTVWLAQADFAGVYSGANPYQSALTGSGIDGNASGLAGYFYGPNAEETGGSWVIVKSDNSARAAGVYTAQRGEVDTDTPSGMADSLNGVYAAYIGGQFITGSAQLDQNQDFATPRKHAFSFARTGETAAQATYNVDGSGVSGNLASGTTLWAEAGPLTGNSERFGDNAYLARASASSTSTANPPLMMAAAGAPTATGSLPISGRVRADMSGLLSDANNSRGYSDFTMLLSLDWSAGKAFSPMKMSHTDDNESPMVLGQLQRETATLAMDVKDKNHPFSSDPGYYAASDNMTVQFYGSEAEMAAGLFTINHMSVNNAVEGASEKGIVVVHDFSSYTNSTRTPETGENWQGYASGLAQGYSALYRIGGSSSFSFNPVMAQVTGGIDLGGGIAFATSSTDANAFFSVHEFGARMTNEQGHPSQFSTQGDYSGAGWTDTSYSAMGYWFHDHGSGLSAVSYLNGSTWVAGLPTSTGLPVSGWADYAGKVLGALAGTSGSSSSWFDLLTGDIDLRVDFARRKTRGSLSNLVRDYDGSVWLAQADFATPYSGTGPYQAGLTGAGVDSGNSTLTGAFYGPNANETGGSWVITQSPGNWATGVFTAKRGDVDTVSPSGMADPVNGIYGAYLGSQFISGTAQMDMNQALESPSAHSFALQRAGHPDAGVSFNAGTEGVTGALNPTTSILSYTGTYTGVSHKAGEEAYWAEIQRTGSPRIYIVAGTPTATSALPVSGVQTASISGLINTGSYTNSVSPLQGSAFLDWTHSKVFVPMALNSADDSPLVLGSVNRSNATLALSAQQLDDDSLTDTSIYGVSSNMDLQLYGVSASLAGSLFTYQSKNNTHQNVGITNSGVVVVHDFNTAGAAPYQPTSTETWQGKATGLLFDAEVSSFTVETGTANFVLIPSLGEVTGQISVNGHGLATTAGDANAYLHPHAFGARTTTADGHPTYFSTQGDFSGQGWTDLRYTTAGYWANDYLDSTWYTFSNYSTWVAGQLTPGGSVPAQGMATYTGKILGVEIGDPATESYVNSRQLLTGNFVMNADFNQRRVSGALTGLDGESSPFSSRIDFLGAFTSNNAYEARFNGLDATSAPIDATYSTLSGLFYGPQAEETGGNWRLSSTNSWAAGVFTGARGDINAPAPAPAIWAGSVNGAFVADFGVVTRDSLGGAQTPADTVLALYRAGLSAGNIRYRSNGGSASDFGYQESTLWTANGVEANVGAYGDATVYADAYMMDFGKSTSYTSNILAYGGTRTTPAQLPSTGQYSYYVSTLVHDLSLGDSHLSNDQLAVDFSTGKVFNPARLQPGDYPTPILIGQVDRSNSRIDLEGVQRGPDNTSWSVGADMSAEFYGADSKILGGLFSIQQTTNDPGDLAYHSMGVMAGHTDGYGLYHSLRTIAEGEAWTGYSANLVLTWNGNAGVNATSASRGTANFVFHPGSGEVEGAIHDTDVVDSSFTTQLSDPNAFLATDGFGALQLADVGSLATPFYYSTRSSYTDWENIPGSALYDYLDKLSYHYTGTWGGQDGLNTFSSSSSWVAGLASGVNVPSNGYARYAGYASGLLNYSSNDGFDYVSGLFGMTADFTHRSVSGKIGNLSTESGDSLLSNGFGFTGSWALGADAYESSSYTPNGVDVAQAGVMGRFYGDSTSRTTETGGLWYMEMTGGDTLFGIYSGLDRNVFERSAGVLAQAGSAGALATANPLASYTETWNTGVSSKTIYSAFVTPGGIGEFTSGDTTSAPGILNHNYHQHILNGTSDTFTFTPAYSGIDFKTSDSYVQFTPNRDFYRYVLSGAGGEYIEGYDGIRSTQSPASGISTYYFHQSSLHNGQSYKAPETGKNGLYYGNLYVNWSTGQAYGYNLATGLQQSGVGLFLGRVNAADQRIEGSYLLKTNHLSALDNTGAPRFVTDSSGMSLDLFGAGDQPAGIGGVFNTEWQAGNLASPSTGGQSLVSGFLDRASLIPGYQPAQDEIWNGYAIAYVSTRSTGSIRILGNDDASQVSIKFRPDTASGHVWTSFAAGVDLLSGVPDSNSAILNIQTDANAPSEEMNVTGTAGDNASVYISTKAFAAVQAPSNGSLAATPDFVAAAPEAYGTVEAARYDYTTWGFWGADYDAGKSQTVSPSSLWVAGKLTNNPDMPAAGTATYTGLVAGQVSGSQNAYVQGQLAMNVDFAARSVGGSINNLNLNNNPATPWIATANLNGGLNSGTVQYTAAASGTGITAGVIKGAFYGPQAIETGGRWVIQKNDGSQGTGIFVGKRDAISNGAAN